MSEKGLRFDLVVALCAVLISTIAAGAAIYQTHVIAQQYNAAVWPYLSFDMENSPTFIELDVRNDGLGPAIIRSVAITWDGKPEPSIEALFSPRTNSAFLHEIRRLMLKSKTRPTGTLTTSTPTDGMVIPANSSHTIVRLGGAAFAQLLRPAVSHFDLALCYCSLTGDCWLSDFKNRDAEPPRVRNCPTNRG